MSAPSPSSSLHNLHRLAPTLYSGGEPHGDAAFAELAAMGVRTIVSVDGARPDVAAARRQGIRYIHIPIGYDGVDPEAQAALTRVAREADGPVFVHCHHGKHRGPAAAAVMCMAAGEMDHASALEYLKLAGTAAEYEGLWRDIRQFQPLPDGAELPELVETAEVDSLAAAMAQLDRAWDGLKLCRAAGWRTPAEHADLTPPHQALLVWEGLREGARAAAPVEDRQSDDDAGSEAASADERLLIWMRDAETHAARLRESLEAARPEDADREFQLLENSCARCHAEYRN